MAARAGFQSVAPSGGAGASGGAGVAAALGPGGTPGPPVRMGPAPGQGLYRSPMPGAAYPVSGAGGGARGPGAGPSEGGGLAGGGGREEEGEGLPWEGRGSRVVPRKSVHGEEGSILTCPRRRRHWRRWHCVLFEEPVWTPGWAQRAPGWAAPVSRGHPS